MSSLMEAPAGGGEGTGRGEYPTIESFTYRLDMAAVCRPLIFHLGVTPERVAAPG